MEKVLLCAFNGELMCFVHVLLNGLDMNEKGMEGKIIFEGASVKLIPELEKSSNPFHSLYKQAQEKGLLLGACMACSAKLGVLEAVQNAGLPLLDGMKGHPALSEYMEQGYTIQTF